MDLQTLAIGAAVVVVSTILILLITKCSMSGNSFEKMIEEQRRAQLFADDTPQHRGEKKDKKKKVKKHGKSEKPHRQEEHTSSETEIATERAAALHASKSEKFVELELEPEIIQSTEDTPTKLSRKLKNKPSEKSILKNKDEKSGVTENLRATEVFHPKTVPKDDLEMKHERDRRRSESMSLEDDVAPPVHEKKEKKHPKPAEERVVVKKTVAQETTVTPPVVESRKPGRNQKVDNVAQEGAAAMPTGGAASQLIATVQSATLAPPEVQTLIQILLNKQGGGDASATWTKKSQKGDPLAVLSRQLDDKAKALEEEHQAAVAANLKVKELRAELANEKQHLAALDKKSQDKMNTQGQEILALQSRMRQTHEQHMGETTALRHQLEQMKGHINTDQVSLNHRLTEENKKLQEAANRVQALGQVDVGSLQQQVRIMQDELSKNVRQLQSTEAAKKNLEGKLARHEDQIRKMESGQRDTENVLTRKKKKVPTATLR